MPKEVTMQKKKYSQQSERNPVIRKPVTTPWVRRQNLEEGAQLRVWSCKYHGKESYVFIDKNSWKSFSVLGFTEHRNVVSKEAFTFEEAMRLASMIQEELRKLL